MRTDFLFKYPDDWPRMVRALTAIRRLHTPSKHHGVGEGECEHCSNERIERVPWPCSTIEAMGLTDPLAHGE